MRGKGSEATQTARWTGITPAYAGKSGLIFGAQLVDRDHPRVCGEKSSRLRTACSPRGSPPRMRGKGWLMVTLTVRNRITPAYAGKRIFSRILQGRYKDHPRICGEKFRRPNIREFVRGSPPHMRGKVSGSSSCNPFARITPAYAGKSYVLISEPLIPKDHPRICGEKLTLCRFR